MDEVRAVIIGVSAFDGNSSKKQWSFVRILVLRCTVAVATCTGQPPVFATPQPGWKHCGVWGVQSDQNGSKLPWNFFVHQLFYGNFYQWLYLMRNNGEITKCTWKIGMIPNTKSGNRGVQGWCHSAGLGLSLSFGREVAPNGTILPLQSTEQQAFFFSWLCGKRFLKVCRSLFRTTDFRIFRVLCGFASAGHIGWWPKPKHSLQRSSLGLPGKARIHAVQLICCGYTSILYTSTLLLFLPWRLGRNCNIALYKFEFAGAHWSRVSVAWCICCFPLGWDRWTLWAACGLVAHGTVCLQRVETCILSGWPCISAVFRFSSLRPVISKLRHLAMAFQQVALLT